METVLIALCRAEKLVTTGCIYILWPQELTTYLLYVFIWSGPFNIEESCETSKLLCDSPNSIGLISDPVRKLVELPHLTKSGRWDYEGGHLEQSILKDFRFEM